MIETLMFLAAIGLPSGALAFASLGRIGAVHAQELKAKASLHDEPRHPA